MRLTRLFSPLLILLLTGHATASAATLEQVLSGARPPGVVIEVVGRDDGLRKGVPLLRDVIGQIRKRFPGIDIALVSHGREQFALLEGAEEFTDIQRSMRELIADTQVNVHVCGAHAERAGRSAEDFVSFVNVAAHGPIQIRDYEALGYLRLKVVLRP